MKKKTTTTYKKKGNYPRVSQSSKKIYKEPWSMVRVTTKKENRATLCQTSQNDFCKSEESLKDKVMENTSLYFNSCSNSIGESYLPFNGCSDALGQNIVPFNGFTHSMGLMPLPLNEFLCWETSIPFNGFIDSMGQNSLSPNGYIDSMWDANLSFSGCTDSIVVTAIPFTEDLHVNYNQLDLDRVDYFDPETFTKNCLVPLDGGVDILSTLVNQEISKKKNVTLVLDLDETLIHSSLEKCEADFTFQIMTDRKLTVYVRKRPFLQEFLEKVSDMFEVIIFTASQSVYAAKVLDVLDPNNKLFARRMYRESCTWKDRRCIKDLRVLGIDLAKVFIVDNTPGVFRFQVNNGIPIKSWYNDPSDSALPALLSFLEKLVDVDDVRPIIAKEFGGKECSI